MSPESRIYVAGHTGLVGSALVRRLRSDGYQRLLFQTRSELDLTQASAVDTFFATEEPEYVFLAAAKVGGIVANRDQPVEFIRDNLRIELNIIEAAHRHGVKKLLFLGSSCIYPKHAPQPMKEEHLLTGRLEPTNQPYALAKIAGLELCRSYQRQHGDVFISAMPTNLYGPGDNFDLTTSHVLPALICKFHEARETGAEAVTVWGTGTPRREFLHVDDLADACLFLMQHYESPEPINVGWGRDISIGELSERIGDVVGFDGQIVFDTSKPDGTPRKLLDTSRLRALGWEPRVPLDEGIRSTYNWYRKQLSAVAG